MPRTPLNPWPSSADWRRQAWIPSRFAPTLEDVRAAQSQPVSIPRSLAEWIDQFTAKDLIFEQGELVGCSLTARAFLTGMTTPVPKLRLERVRLIAVESWIKPLAESEALRQLTHLDLTACRLSDHALSELLATPQLRFLQKISLNRNNLASWQTLSPLWQWPALTDLDVTGNGLNPADLPKLPATVLAFHLSRAGLEWSGCWSFWQRPDIQQLRHFTMSSVATPILAGKTVDLRFNHFDQLPPQDLLENVEVLLLAGNRYSRSLREELMNRPLPRLRECDLAAM